jgi:hypothetical protein
MKLSMVLLTALLAACTVGEVPRGDGGGGSNDNDRNVCEPRVAAPTAAHMHAASGTDPAGARARSACMATTCHGPGGTSTPFAFAGTVYKETAAVTAATGVTVRIFAPGGMKSLAEAATDDAGNFVIRNPTMFAAFPYETHVTACGASASVGGIRPMISPIATADANCNVGGSCHGTAGTQGAIYLSD